MTILIENQCLVADPRDYYCWDDCMNSCILLLLFLFNTNRLERRSYLWTSILIYVILSNIFIHITHNEAIKLRFQHQKCWIYNYIISFMILGRTIW